MFGRFFKNKDDGKGGPPPGHRTTGAGSGAPGAAGAEEPVGGGFFNLPPPVAKPHGGSGSNLAAPGNSMGPSAGHYPPAPAYGNTQETAPPAVAPGNASGVDMFGGMALKNPSGGGGAAGSAPSTGYQPHQYGGYNGGQPAAPSAPQQSTGSLFSGMNIASSGPGSVASGHEEAVSSSVPERRKPSRSSAGSFNYLDVARSSESTALGSSQISRTSATSSTGTATSRSSSKVKRKKKKSFRPGFGRQLSDESAAALQRGDLKEDEVIQKVQEGGSRRPSTISDRSDSSRSVSGPTDLAHLLPPVRAGSVLSGLTVHSTGGGSTPSTGGVLAGLTVHTSASPASAQASASPGAGIGAGNGVLSGLSLHDAAKKAGDNVPVEEATPEPEVAVTRAPPAPPVPATPEDRLFNTLRDFHASALSFREATVKQNEEENRLLERKSQLANQLTQYEMDLRDVEAQQHHACEVEDFEKADALNATINSVRHCITLTESDVRKVDSELVAFVKAKEKAFANQLKSTRGTLRELEKFREDQESERVSLREEFKQFETNQTETLQFEAERIDTEMHHVTVSLENVVAEKSEIEATIEGQCSSEFAVRAQLMEEKEAVEEEVRELERLLKLKRERVQEIQASIDTAQRDIDTVRGRYSRQLKRIADREEGILKTKAEVESDGEQLKTQRVEFQEQMEQYTEDIETIGKRITTVRKEMRAASLLAGVLEVQETRREQSIVRKKQQTAELSSLNDAAAVAEQSFTMLKSQHEELEKSMAIHQNAIASAESMIPRLEQEKKAAAAQRNFKEAARISKDIKGLEKDRSTAEEMVEVVEMELQDLKERIDKREVEFEEKKKELKEMEKHLELASLQEMWKEAKQLRSALRKIEKCKSEGTAADEGIDFRSSAMLLVQAEYDACLLQVETLEKKYDVSDPAKDEEEEDDDDDSDSMSEDGQGASEHEIGGRSSLAGRLDADGSDADVEVAGDGAATLEDIAAQLSELEAQIEAATADENYELAAKLDEKIEALKQREQAIEASMAQSATVEDVVQDTEPVEEASKYEEYAQVEDDADEVDYHHQEMTSPVSAVQSPEELANQLETIQLRVVMLEKQIELATENDDFETAAIYDEELVMLREQEKTIRDDLAMTGAVDTFASDVQAQDGAPAGFTKVESPKPEPAAPSTSSDSLFGGLQMSVGPSAIPSHESSPVESQGSAEKTSDVPSAEDEDEEREEIAALPSSAPTHVEIDSPTSYSSSTMKDSFFGTPQVAKSSASVAPSASASASASDSLFGGLQLSGGFQASTLSLSSSPEEKKSPTDSVASKNSESDAVQDAGMEAVDSTGAGSSSGAVVDPVSDMFGGLQMSSSSVNASESTPAPVEPSTDMFSGLQLSSSMNANAETGAEAEAASSNDMFGGLQLSSSAVASAAAPIETESEVGADVEPAPPARDASVSVSSTKSAGDTRMSIHELSEQSESGSPASADEDAATSTVATHEVSHDSGVPTSAGSAPTEATQDASQL